MAAPVQTLEDTIIACGVIDDGTLFDGLMRPKRISMEIFGNDFDSCVNMSFSDFNEECKTFSGLTVVQGQIRLTPIAKRNIKALMEWTKGMIITGRDPASVIFS